MESKLKEELLDEINQTNKRHAKVAEGSQNFRRRRRDTFNLLAQRAEQCLAPKAILSNISKCFPITKWLPKYNLQNSFFADLSAGLTMGIFAVPTGIAHAGICGVEPVYGLYTSIFPTFLYMIFGNSKYNALGPFAILSVLTQSAIEKAQTIIEDQRFNSTRIANETFGASNSSVDTLLDLNNITQFGAFNTTEFHDDIEQIRPIHIATTVMFLSGIFNILLGVFRADFLSCYLSEQVMSGFVVGGYVHVFFSQIGEALGIKLPARSGAGSLFYASLLRAQDLFEHFGEIQLPTAIISASSMVFLLFCRNVVDPWLKGIFIFPIPYEFLLVVIGITAIKCADLSSRYNVLVVRNIPTDFPPPALPRFELIPSLFVTTLGITIVTVSIHLTVVKIIENKYHHKTNSCHELYSLGCVSVLSSAFPVFPVTSIFARTLIGNADKNTTQLTIFFSSLALLIGVLYVGPALEYLPKCILASIILVSLATAFDKFKELKRLWPLFKTDLIIFIVTFLLTSCYDLAKGLLASVGFAVLTTVIRNQWYSSWHILTHDSEIDNYREASKQQLNEIESNACVFRFDGALIFTSVQKFTKAVQKAVKRWERRDINSTQTDEAGCRWRIRHQSRRRRSSDTELTKYGANQKPTILIIDCSGFPYIDYLGLCTLKKVYSDFTSTGVAVKFAAPKASMIHMFENTDFYSTVPETNVYATVKLAADKCGLNKTERSSISLDLNEEELSNMHKKYDDSEINYD
ncbi:Sulfate permease family protein 3 [Aphelenchoides bicaudatus]|nr:Sulfate permease family protein 3 [Aphelenchoides bicaudatus]